MEKEKIDRLDEVNRRIRELSSGRLAERRIEVGDQAVVGEGPSTAKMMVIGEAPGAAEAKTGRPFVGRAGRVLDGMLASIGLNKEQIYVTNIIKDRPPGNRDPRAAEIRRYQPFLEQEITIVQPEIIVSLGRFAMRFLLNRYDLPSRGKKISDLQGEVFRVDEAYGGVLWIPLYHPAAVLYNPDLKKQLEEGFQMVGEQYGRGEESSPDQQAAAGSAEGGLTT